MAQKTVTTNGNAQVSTAQKKFGSGSALFDGTGDYLSLADHADWNFGSGNFTIDCWIYSTSSSSNRVFVHRVNGGFGLILSIYQSKLNFIASTSGTTWDINVQVGTIPTNAWTHIAVSRSGSNFYGFVNGTKYDISSAGGTITSPGTPLYIGADYSSGNDGLIGYLDEFRVSSIARWTANFTPPTAPHRWDYNTVLLLHCDGANASTTFTDENSYIGCTGGDITTDGSYTVHTFKLAHTGTNFVASKAGNVEVLVVGGGAGGGGNSGTGDGGGGGAGAVRHDTSHAVTATSYTITVGDKGTAGTSAAGGDGYSSIFDTITSLGGGGGGYYDGNNGRNGGSGGGGGQKSSGTTTGGTGNTGGNNGGNGGLHAAAGGGGASAVGANSTDSVGGDGGVGVGYDIAQAGTTVYYGGGGGGGAATTKGTGGTGGGGNGAKANPSATAPTAGTNDLGGGGGGGSDTNGGATGGSGIVIIRYLTADFNTTTVVAQVSASYDDCYYRVSGYWEPTGANMQFGSWDADESIGMRFLSVAVTPGKTIASAFITLRANANDASDTCNVIIKGENSVTPATFSTSADFLGRSWLATTVAWNAIGHWTSGSDYTTVDISPIIQAQIGLAGWASGDNVVFGVFNNGSSAESHRCGYSYDGSTTYAPKLTIIYTNSSSITVSLTDVMPASSAVPTPTLPTWIAAPVATASSAILAPAIAVTPYPTTVTASGEGVTPNFIGMVHASIVCGFWSCST